MARERLMDDCGYTFAECEKECLCVDCESDCMRAGDKVADCPVYPVMRSKECEGQTSCDTCTWLDGYIEDCRKEQK